MKGVAGEREITSQHLVLTDLLFSQDQIFCIYALLRESDVPAGEMCHTLYDPCSNQPEYLNYHYTLIIITGKTHQNSDIP